MNPVLVSLSVIVWIGLIITYTITSLEGKAAFGWGDLPWWRWPGVVLGWASCIVAIVCVVGVILYAPIALIIGG